MTFCAKQKKTISLYLQDKKLTNIVVNQHLGQVPGHLEEHYYPILCEGWTCRDCLLGGQEEAEWCYHQGQVQSGGGWLHGDLAGGARQACELVNFKFCHAGN